MIFLFSSDKKTVQEITRLRIKVSDFEVKEVIGRGFFGEVRLVREIATGTIHAMKVLEKNKTLSQADVSDNCLTFFFFLSTSSQLIPFTSKINTNNCETQKIDIFLY